MGSARWFVPSRPVLVLDKLSYDRFRRTIYLITNEMTNEYVLIAIGTDKSIKWRTNLTAYTASLPGHIGLVPADYSPVMGSDGSIYVHVWTREGGDMYGTEYLLSIRNSSMGLANSSWPMFQHDARRTGNFSKLTPHPSIVFQLMLLLSPDQ